MSKFRLAVCTGFAASALLLIPAGSASAHVHGITPLGCTTAPLNAGGNQTNQTPASSTPPSEGPISPGPIPINMGGNVTDGGADAAVCDG
jgi:hypothetical protein